ncbi:hypothetical protein G4B88_008540 [Cannabis sativa]|uniref:Reverse transcriptase zinc-binding domain-containing protein n=1 Tax=Cannabis sativa TaxID=3483 RepID=A0A7J6EKX4_CANSA|nr:hypothetical protein G4B88_008540 [Cannabis sativa]
MATTDQVPNKQNKEGEQEEVGLAKNQQQVVRPETSMQHTTITGRKAQQQESYLSTWQIPKKTVQGRINDKNQKKHGDLSSGNNFNVLQLTQMPVMYNKAVWSSITIPKHRFILWQVLNSHLLTKDNLLRFHIELDSMNCPMCEEVVETHEHTFFSCVVSRRILDKLFIWMNHNGWPIDYKGWINWICMAVYNIWINKNNCIFNGYSRTIVDVVNDVKSTLKWISKIEKVAEILHALPHRHIHNILNGQYSNIISSDAYVVSVTLRLRSLLKKRHQNYDRVFDHIKDNFMGKIG